jgi:hypothetical protein
MKRKISQRMMLGILSILAIVFTLGFTEGNLGKEPVQKTRYRKISSHNQKIIQLTEEEMNRIKGSYYCDCSHCNDMGCNCGHEYKDCKCWRDTDGSSMKCDKCSQYCQTKSNCPTCNNVECTCGCGYIKCLSHPDPYSNCITSSCGNTPTTQCCGSCTPSNELYFCSLGKDPCRQHCGKSRCACQATDGCTCPFWGYCDYLPDCLYCEFVGGGPCDEGITPPIDCPGTP